ncbi:MAG: hypothetical protein ABI574_15300 [Burkholderiales bacterium]
MSLVRKASTAKEFPQALQAEAAGIPRNADVQCKRARTLAKQQQASERVVAAATELIASWKAFRLRLIVSLPLSQTLQRAPFSLDTNRSFTPPLPPERIAKSV